jgi:hypothetical protein
MATGFVLLLVGIWIMVNAVNGNFGNVLAGNLSIGAAVQTPTAITNSTAAPKTA